jgi:hypothetical protein
VSITGIEDGGLFFRKINPMELDIPNQKRNRSIDHNQKE